MLHPADVLVHRHPVVHRLSVEHGGVAVRAAIAVEIPGGLHEGIHGIRLPPGFIAAALRAGGPEEGFQRRQRGLAAFQQVGLLGQLDGQVRFGDRHHPAPVAVDHGDRRAPVPLPGDAPVPKPVADRLFADAFLVHMGGDGFLGVFIGHAVESPGVDHDSFTGIGLVHGGAFQRLPFGLNHHDDLQAVFSGEVEIPLVVGRHRHDRTGAVFHEREIGGVDRHAAAAHGVEAVGPDEHPFFFVGFHGPVGAVQKGHPVHEFGHRRLLFRGLRQLGDQRMLRRQAHEGGPEDGILTGGEN